MGTFKAGTIWCTPFYRESHWNKGSKERQGPTLGVRFIESQIKGVKKGRDQLLVSIKRESTALQACASDTFDYIGPRPLASALRTVKYYALEWEFPSCMFQHNIRDFKIQRRGRQRERQKKTIGLTSKTAISHVHHTFLYISFPFLHDCDVKMPNFAFYGGRK